MRLNFGDLAAVFTDMPVTVPVFLIFRRPDVPQFGYCHGISGKLDTAPQALCIFIIRTRCFALCRHFVVSQYFAGFMLQGGNIYSCPCQFLIAHSAVNYLGTVSGYPAFGFFEIIVIFFRFA